jgi:hypothetical protein
MHRGKPVVLKRIERELLHRENKMQAEIFKLAPLLVYALSFLAFCLLLPSFEPMLMSLPVVTLPLNLLLENTSEET